MPSTTQPDRISAVAESLTAFSQRHSLSYSYAFQPIVDVLKREVFSYEALIRGKANESAYKVLSQVPENFKHRFDQQSRVVAIALAARLGLPCHLNLNFLPRSLFVSDNAISTTLEAADHFGLAMDRLVIEVTEGEVISDYGHMATQLNKHRLLGVKLAIDDFGAGYSGLNMLADFQPDQVKVDMNLVRDIESHGPRQSIVRAILQVCGDLGIDVIAEGVETVPEFEWFAQHGVRLFQGYLFARPAFEAFPTVHFPAIA